MDALTLTDFNGVETIDSRQVAKAIEKDHAHLMRDIAKYCEYLNESKIGLVDFFIESTYTDSKGEVRPCYLITRKGCEMIANKMTGQKGVTFTALYINAFHAMEHQIKNSAAHTESTSKKLEIQEMNARTRMANLYLKLAEADTKSGAYKDILVAKAAEVLAGKELIPLPLAEQKMYTATEIGEMFGVSAQRIGIIANQNGMKIPEFGAWYRDKSPYSSKEVDAFRYNDKAIEKFHELLG